MTPGGNVTAEIAYTYNEQNLKLSGSNPWTKQPLPKTRWTFPAHWVRCLADSSC